MDSLSVRFVEVRSVVAVLSVDAPADLVSLETICGVLFSLRVQVVHAVERRGPGLTERRIAVCDFAGGPLRARRRHQIEAAVARALAEGLFQPVRPLVRVFRVPGPPSERVVRPAQKPAPSVPSPQRAA